MGSREPGSGNLTHVMTPVPDELEAAAIMAAMEALWPRPAAGQLSERDISGAWRFSGRWWQRDRFATAERPW